MAKKNKAVKARQTATSHMRQSVMAARDCLNVAKTLIYYSGMPSDTIAEVNTDINNIVMGLNGLLDE